MSQEWTWINLEVPGAAAISWEGVPGKESGSPTACFVCAEDLLFPPLPHFWTLLISRGVRTMLPLSLLLWPPSQEALYYFRNTWGHFRLKMNMAERRMMNDKAFLADVGYKKRSRCGETSLTKGVCQKHGEIGFQCGNDTARFREEKTKQPEA